MDNLTHNPDELGLAHFYKYLPFMGTKKFPSEKDCQDYLSKNGENSDALTSIEFIILMSIIKV